MTKYSDPSNEITNYPHDVCGFNPDLRTTWPMFRLGTFGGGKQGPKWLYVKASESVATGTCTASTSTYLLTDTGGNYTATAAFAADDYGWVKQTAADLA